MATKCEAAFDVLGHDVVLGYSAEYSSEDAAEFSTPGDWRSRQVHVLGGSPTVQWQVKRTLTGPRLNDAPPANIVGGDWSVPQKVAYKREY